MVFRFISLQVTFQNQLLKAQLAECNEETNKRIRLVFTVRAYVIFVKENEGAE